MTFSVSRKSKCSIWSCQGSRAPRPPASPSCWPRPGRSTDAYTTTTPIDSGLTCCSGSNTAAGSPRPTSTGRERSARVATRAGRRVGSGPCVGVAHATRASSGIGRRHARHPDDQCARQPRWVPCVGPPGAVQRRLPGEPPTRRIPWGRGRAMCNRLPPRGRRDLRLSAKQIADLADEIGASAGMVAGRSQFATNDWTSSTDCVDGSHTTSSLRRCRPAQRCRRASVSVTTQRRRPYRGGGTSCTANTLLRDRRDRNTATMSPHGENDLAREARPTTRGIPASRS